LPRLGPLVWTGLCQGLWSIQVLVPPLLLKSQKRGGSPKPGGLLYLDGMSARDGSVARGVMFRRTAMLPQLVRFVEPLTVRPAGLALPSSAPMIFLMQEALYLQAFLESSEFGCRTFSGHL
jgi:hypothetical protein